MCFLLVLLWPCPIPLLTIGPGGPLLLLVGQVISLPTPCSLLGCYLLWLVGAWGSIESTKASHRDGCMPSKLSTSSGSSAGNCIGSHTPSVQFLVVGIDVEQVCIVWEYRCLCGHISLLDYGK